MPIPQNDVEPNDLPDLARLKAGDESAWTAAFRRLWPIALRAARTPSAALSNAEAEEMASEAIASAAQKIGQVKTPGQLKALVAIIAQRRAISAARAKSAFKRGPATISLQQHADEDRADLEPCTLDAEVQKDLDQAECALLLQQAMSTLNDLERSLLVGQLVDDLSQKELGERSGLPIGTVGSKIVRALDKVGRKLEKTPDLMQELRQFLR